MSTLKNNINKVALEKMGKFLKNERQKRSSESNMSYKMIMKTLKNENKKQTELLMKRLKSISSKNNVQPKSLRNIYNPGSPGRNNNRGMKTTSNNRATNNNRGMKMTSNKRGINTRRMNIEMNTTSDRYKRRVMAYKRHFEKHLFPEKFDNLSKYKQNVLLKSHFKAIENNY